MRLLEREPALAALTGYADEARHGDGRLVLVAGEAGVGKSALVERFAQELPDARWSWGACDGLFTPRPLGPLCDIADQLGDPIARLCRDCADRDELFRTLLRQLAEPGRLDVAVVEDVHWADEATLDLLRYLARRLRGAPVLLIVTYRDDALAADDPLRVALGDLARQRPTRRIELVPLSAGAVRELAGDSGLPASALYELTGGNPFYVTEVLRAGVAAVPASARDAVLARVAHLGSRARESLEVAALTGTRVEPALLAAVTGYPPDVVDELIAGGLLVTDGTGLRFRHEIARLATAQEVPAHRAGPIHGRILEALRANGSTDDSRLAFHAEAAGDGPAVLRHAAAAARHAAALGSHREAVAQFSRALRHHDGAGVATVAGLCDGLADELAVLDRMDEAAPAAERALALWRESGDALREGDTVRRLSRIQWNLCRGRDVMAMSETAVAILEPLGPTVELAWAYATHAHQLMLYAEFATAAPIARRAQAIAEPLGALDVLSDALNTEAACVAHDEREWLGMLRRALDLALSGHDQERAARAYCNLVALCGTAVRLTELERYFRDGLAYCEEHDLTQYSTFLRGEWSGALLRLGRWDEAVALNTELLGTAGPSPANRLCAVIRLGILLARRGDPDAWAYLDEAAGTSDASGEPYQTMVTRTVRAEAHWLAGRPDDARREAELAYDAGAPCHAPDRGAVAVWLRRLGSPHDPVEEFPEPYRMHRDGYPAKAARVWMELGFRYEAALALYDAGDEASLREALALLTELGAEPAARIVRRRLRALGVRGIPTGPRTATRANPGGLTAREHEVLGLIHAGRSNAQIAGELFISEKTVDHHVSAILAKLGAPSRTAAAHQAARLGLLA